MSPQNDRLLAGADEDAAAEVRVEGEEVFEARQVGAAENAHLRQRARAGPCDDIGPAVAVDVAGADAHAAGERRQEGEEAPQQRTVLAAGDGHLRPTSRV